MNGGRELIDPEVIEALIERNGGPTFAVCGAEPCLCDAGEGCACVRSPILDHMGAFQCSRCEAFLVEVDIATGEPVAFGPGRA